MKQTMVTLRYPASRHQTGYRGKHYRRSIKLTILGDVAMILLATCIGIFALSGILKDEGVKAVESQIPIVKELEDIEPKTVAEPNTLIPLVEVTESEVTEMVEEEVIPELSPQDIMTNALGADLIETDLGNLTRYELPTIYYPGIDFSSFQPWMSYKVITNPGSAAYKVVTDERLYVDEYGLCRFETDPETQFTIDGKDDYVIALGTYYKEKGTCGSRYLIVTSTGAYTAITGDEKSDAHTDEHHMFSLHSDGSCAGIIEWLVDTPQLESMMKRMGSVTYGPVEELHGEILYIYRID